MVVLASSVCTKTGKAVISRQYVEMSRPRIEGLLASFPKMISAGTQHTYVETDTVRYIYQPLEDLYMVLITNKQSNILQDIDTLHLFARCVTDYARSLKEAEILSCAFELLCAFDEIVALGYRENVTVAQIRTYCEMDSHEEKLQEMQQKSKEREAVEAAKLKARQLDMQRRMTGKIGAGQQSGGFSASRSSISSTYTPPVAQQSRPVVPVQAPAGPSQGMQLGGKARASDMLDAINLNEGLPTTTMADTMNVSPVSGSTAAAVPASTTKIGPVHIHMEEKISAALNRDGGLESMEVKGELMLRIADADKARLRIAMSVTEDEGLQFKTHPHVDKAVWAQDSVVVAKDPSKPFPVNQPTGVLKWRHVSKDESRLPLSINFWPSPSGDGTIDCSVEYELLAEEMSLVNVVVSIPMTSAPPKVDSVEGEYVINSATKCLDWKVALIDSTSPSGTLEFSVPGNDVSVLFPVRVSFSGRTQFSPVEVTGVSLVDGNVPVDFTKETLLVTEDYRVV